MDGLRPLVQRVCPECGEINAYGWYCDNDRYHGIDVVRLTTQTYYPKAFLVEWAEDKIGSYMIDGMVDEATGIQSFVADVLGVELPLS